MSKSSDVIIAAHEPATLINVHDTRWQRVRLCAIAMLVVIILTCAAFAVLKYFPRPITGSVESFVLDSASPYSFNDGGLVDTHWKAQVNIDNPNHWGVHIDAMRITAFMQHDRREPLVVAHLHDITLAPKAMTTVGLGVTVPLKATGGTIPALLEECIDKKQADIHFDVDVDLHLTHWTGKWLHFDVDHTVPCVLPDSLLSADPIVARRLLAELL